jgi:hypothetical protein
VFVLQAVSTIPDGSFSVTRVITPKPGVNTIVAKSVNFATHETCTIKGSL